MRKRATIRGIEADAWEMLECLRDEERRFTGAIISDCIRHYWEATFVYEDELPLQHDQNVSE